MTTAGDEDGERFRPEMRGQIQYEHVHRYLVAANLVRGLDVADIASGEGYGSLLLASSAKSVVGVDIDGASVSAASLRYVRDNLRFKQGDCAAVPLSNASVDAVVSFETIEHTVKQDEFIAEVRRILRPRGLFIISSPNRAIYSDATGFRNPYHVRELYLQELRDLLSGAFPFVQMFGQQVLAASVIVELYPTGAEFVGYSQSPVAQSSIEPISIVSPMYFIAVCSDEAIDLSDLRSFYIDLQQDIFAALRSRADETVKQYGQARERLIAVSEAVKSTVTWEALLRLPPDAAIDGRVDELGDARFAMAVSDGVQCIGTGESLFAAGWALCSHEANPVDYVVLSVRSDLMSTCSRTERMDLISHYGPQARYGGFRGACKVPLAPGPCELSIDAISAGGKRRLHTQQLFVIDADLIFGAADSGVHIDSIARKVELDTDVTVDLQDLCLIRGWAVDMGIGGPVLGAAVLVDGDKILPCRYRISRPDVQHALGLITDAVGFEAEFVPAVLGVGFHEMRALGVRKDASVAVSLNVERFEIVSTDVAP